MCKYNSTRNVSTEELDHAYALYKTCLYEFVEMSFGWNEAYQCARFRTSYDRSDLYWSTNSDGKTHALYCFNNAGINLHVSLLLVIDNFRGMGIGSAIMDRLEHQAAIENKPATLSTFKVNTKAIRFYSKRGYEIVGHDDHFYDMVKQPRIGNYA